MRKDIDPAVFREQSFRQEERLFSKNLAPTKLGINLIDQAVVDHRTFYPFTRKSSQHLSILSARMFALRDERPDINTQHAKCLEALQQDPRYQNVDERRGRIVWFAAQTSLHAEGILPSMAGLIKKWSDHAVILEEADHKNGSFEFTIAAMTYAELAVSRLVELDVISSKRGVKIRELGRLSSITKESDELFPRSFGEQNAVETYMDRDKKNFFFDRQYKEWRLLSGAVRNNSRIGVQNDTGYFNKIEDMVIRQGRPVPLFGFMKSCSPLEKVQAVTRIVNSSQLAVNANFEVRQADAPSSPALDATLRYLREVPPRPLKNKRRKGRG